MFVTAANVPIDFSPNDTLVAQIVGPYSRFYANHTAAAWSDYPASLPQRGLLIQRPSDEYILNDYNSIQIHAGGGLGKNAYATLAAQALSVTDHRTRFNLLLRGSSSSAYETVFSADYDSTYYWKVDGTSGDLTHKFQQSGNTIAIMGWDDSANGWKVETGGAFSTTPGIFIGSAYHNVCIGAEVDSAVQLTVYEVSLDSIIRAESGSGDAYLQLYTDSSSDAFLHMGYGASPGGIDYDGTLNSMSIYSNNTKVAITVDGNGYVYLNNIRNLTNTNYLRFNSSGKEVTWLSSSDIRLKKNIIEWEPDSLTFLMKQRLIRFDRKDGSSYNEIGWDATQMEKLMPEMTWRDEKGYVNFKDAHFPLHFHRAIVQLGEKVAALETLEDRVSRLERENVDLRRQLLNIKN